MKNWYLIIVVTNMSVRKPNNRNLIAVLQKKAVLQIKSSGRTKKK